jgi:hypothetical protein
LERNCTSDLQVVSRLQNSPLDTASGANPFSALVSKLSLTYVHR